jgi:hypothetical protein
MQGEYRGDFTRDTFDPNKQFLRVLTQQGRVQLDADPNEQASILIHYLQSLAVDLMGPHAAPTDENGDLGAGFNILGLDGITKLPLPPDQLDELKRKVDKDGFVIGKGKYYVDGILCENNEYISFSEQPSSPLTVANTQNNPVKTPGKYLVYLDVWERHIHYIQDEFFSEDRSFAPSIREVALNGADTATRSKIVWQIDFFKLNNNDLKREGGAIYEAGDYASVIYNNYVNFVATLQGSDDQSAPRPRISRPGTGKLKVRAKKSETIPGSDPCIIKPSSSFQGSENQLYRVEIHDGGPARKSEQEKSGATFKWSRENSAVIFPIRKLATSSGSITAPNSTITITLAHLGRDDRFTLKPDDLVEVIDDDYVLQVQAKPLLKVVSIDYLELEVTLSGVFTGNFGRNPQKHPYLRRWDRNKDSSAAIIEAQFVEEGKWLLLENGIEISFQSIKDNPSFYQTGDYWLIPSRTATGDIEWPRSSSNEPLDLPPHGIVHHYAPLAVLEVKAGGAEFFDCRRKLKPMWK